MDVTFRQPEFLSAGDHPVLRIRCPVHGFVRFSANERKVIDHPLFRRLRHIKQLALTDLLYPGATHTRFAHSLGVMHVATLAFDRLMVSQGDVFASVLKSVSEIQDRPIAIARQVLRLAALLHDVGHAPFSHAAESVIHRGAGHEELTIQMLEEAGLLGSTIDGAFFAGCSQLVANVIRGGAKLPPQLQILRDIVSGQMDADRTDYLLRDSLSCGVDYGRFDHGRMIESLELHQEVGGTLEMALDRGGIHTFEALILARYQMNMQVYYHRVRRIYDYYLQEYFKAKGDEWLNSPEKILAQNDTTAMSQLFEDAAANVGAASQWAQRIVNRRHHRLVLETGETTNAADLRNSRQVLKGLQDKFPDLNFVWDNAKASIHKLELPEDMSGEGYVQLQVVDSGSARPLGQQSHILRRVPREFQIARIFCDVDQVGEEVRREVRDFAVTEYRALGGK